MRHNTSRTDDRDKRTNERPNEQLVPLDQMSNSDWKLFFSKSSDPKCGLTDQESWIVVVAF